MKLYSLPSCGKCKILKDKMEKMGIQFEVIDDVLKLREAGVIGIPVLELDTGEKLDFFKANNYINSIGG